jgi:hypothetical protein
MGGKILNPTLTTHTGATTPSALYSPVTAEVWMGFDILLVVLVVVASIGYRKKG